MHRLFIGPILLDWMWNDLSYLTTISGGLSLRLNGISVPTHVQVGGNATLICDFDMESDSLYSVKWYKNDREFYRFVPNEYPKKQDFPAHGIHVNVSKTYCDFKLTKVPGSFYYYVLVIVKADKSRWLRSKMYAITILQHHILYNMGEGCYTIVRTTTRMYY